MGILYIKGIWRDLYFSEEIKVAEKYGYKIVETFNGYSFEKNSIFKQFTYMMNSLYGRYAITYEHTKEIYQGKDNYQQVETKRFENVAISAATASFGRIYMYDYIMENKLTLYYWDTDGIIIKEKLTENVGNSLGQFRLVNEIEKGICISPKFHSYKTREGYRHILRSISKKKYQINKEELHEAFLLELQKFPYNKYHLDLEIPLKNL